MKIRQTLIERERRIDARCMKDKHMKLAPISDNKTPKADNQRNETREAIDRALLELAECSQTSIERALNFRKGQRDRLKGLPCMSTNGSYLDGWYDPDKQIPPSLTEAQVIALNLSMSASNTVNH
jgi:hypothetical protein